MIIIYLNLKYQDYFMETLYTYVDLRVISFGKRDYFNVAK